MRIALLLTMAAMAAEAPKLTVEERLSVIEQLRNSDRAEADYRRAAAEMEAAKKRMENAQAKLKQIVPELLKKHGAEKCQLDLDANIVCPPAPAPEKK